MGLAALGLGIWLGLCFLIIGDAIPASYQITRFPFGPNVYELSEPTIDWTDFKGRVELALKGETFAITIFEGSDKSGQNWVNMIGIVEKVADQSKVTMLVLSIHENVLGDPSKIKTTTFYHKAYIETGIPDFKMILMSPEPDLREYIEKRIMAEKVKKHAI